MMYSFFSLRSNNKKQRLINVLIVLLVITLLTILLEYLSHKYNIGIPCLFHEVTGLYCPGCGLTRGIESLFKLDFYQAFRYNALLITALPFAMLCIIDKIQSYIRNNKTWFYDRIPNYVWIIFLIIAILFAILRNIPLFDYLAPTKV